MNPIESESDKRRYPRVKARILHSPPRFYGPPRLHGQKRPISDISPIGMRIFSDELLKEGKGVQIELDLPSGRSVKTTAKVVWIKELPPGSEGRFDVGLEFLVISNEAFNELRCISENSSTDE